MVIELLGIPGCGKSTYVRNFIKENKDALNPLELYLYDDLRFKQNMNKIKLLFLFFLSHPIKSIELTIAFNRVKFKSKFTKLKMFTYLFSIVSIYSLCITKYSQNLIILDEGINQVIWGISYNSFDSEQSIYKLQKLLFPYFADEIIFFRVPKYVIKERLLARTNSGGSELQKDILKNEELIDKSISLVEIIAKRVNELSTIKLVVIDF
ncbi:hypothetical protein OXPF_31550 [Oxobacter pfennigii]|uniref:Uncharacterized protein n=1 Tax=Oxobacter pfennigii TaxID=36849 RepID=A0A0P8YVI3_9CLOT|nr:hypothetical protein [Oxobacter pfennigii]KPU43713.1 hypothetical protein OXPF_31550 [Oxobacter pfennigii]